MTDEIWDVVIAGAGPAGSMAAIGSAQSGLRVLLVDRYPFPRHKVCGCCVSGLAVSRLEAAGLANFCGNLGAHRLREFRLMANQKSACLPLGCGYAVSRQAFDSALSRKAEESGAVFLSGTHARLLEVQKDVCRVTLRQKKVTRTVRSRIVLCADGLAGNFLGLRRELAPRIADRARIGLSTIVEHSGDGIEEGVIYMAVGRKGYAGLVTLEDGTVNIAAALDASALAGAYSTGSTIRELFVEAGLHPVPDLSNAQWTGTSPLTRRRPALGGERILILGDAAGYVEPFTGEGIAWALSSGQLVLPMVRSAVERWDPNLVGAWEHSYRRQLGRRQIVCRIVSRGLRHPVFYRSAIRLLNWKPSLADRLVRRINRDFEGTATA